MAKQANHIHKLKKHKYKTGNSVFFCTLPDCHYKIDVPLAFGKKSVCNICGIEFIMSEYAIKLNRPHCNDCGKVKVTDGDGKTRYVKKVSTKILTEVAAEGNRGLRSRLEHVTSDIMEDDI